MGRPESPLDPQAGPLAAFASDLRALREAAGRPSYRTLARRTHYSVTTLSQAAAGRTLLFTARVCVEAEVSMAQGDDVSPLATTQCQVVRP